MGRFDTEQVLRRKLTRAEVRLMMLLEALRALREHPESERVLADVDSLIQIAESWEQE